MPAKKDQRMMQRDLRMTTSFKNQAKALAHQTERSMSELIRDMIVEYSNGETKPAPAGSDSYTVVRFSVEPADYERAQARARAEGTNLSEAVRSAIEGQLAL
jgi:predicted DNA-binding protein